MRPLVSIIIPVYNVEKYLEECIKSVLRQSWRELEIILVDDGSEDSCGRICDEYQKKDSRIKVIHKKNEGLGAARNDGILACSGEFIMFVDSDDTLSENAVSTLYDRISTDGSDIAVANCISLYPDGTRAPMSEYTEDAVLTPNELLGGFGCGGAFGWEAWGKLYRRALFDTLRYPRLSCGEDLWLYPEVIAACSRISVVCEYVYCYTQRKDSLMNKRTENSRADELCAVVHMCSYLEERGYVSGAEEMFGRAANLLMYIGDTARGRDIVKKELDPSQIRRVLRCAPLKTKIKWMLFRFPRLTAVYKKCKKK